ncbi:MAG: hypothetical protein A2189_07510 [Paenibacillus sp. RIFOXYA1_FULL_44_5]|nr:MAG: hypothetical protein A2189_07510 [Paenibacillus sp. RIFOXYA1_FULL_44_5]
MSDQLKFELDQLSHSLLVTAEYWKTNQDAAGYEHFIHSLEHLKNIIRLYFERLGNQKEQLFSSLLAMQQLVQRQDIVAVIDLIEYNLQPLVCGLKKGSESA